MLLRRPCVLCDRPGDVVCQQCAVGLARAPSLPLPRHTDSCVAVFDYRSARSLVTSLKNGNRRDLVGWLAEQMFRVIEVPAGAVVTWAPTGQARRRSRGYDQAELLARAVARRMGVRCVPMLHRRPGPAQKGRTAGERLANPSFAVPRPCPFEVLLVDDVVTTGATLAAAATALRGGGAMCVHAAVVARAPARIGRAVAEAASAFDAYDEGATHQTREVPRSWTSP